VGLFVLSHLAVFGLTAAVVGGHHISAQFRAAQEQPLFRLGSHSRGGGAGGAPTQVEDDLRAAADELRPPAGDVLRLVHYLETAQLMEAAVVCRRLTWPNCETATLVQMRKVVQ
jgi:hypothetical protein